MEGCNGTTKLLNFKTKQNKPNYKITRCVGLYKIFIFLQLREPITLLLLEPDETEYLDNDDWQYIREYVNVHAIFYEATNMMEGEKYPSSSLYIPTITALLYSLSPMSTEYENFTDREKTMSDELHAAIEARFGDLLDNQKLIMAMILDPRIKILNKLDIRSQELCKATVIEQMARERRNSQPVPERVNARPEGNGYSNF